MKAAGPRDTSSGEGGSAPLPRTTGGRPCSRANTSASTSGASWMRDGHRGCWWLLTHKRGHEALSPPGVTRPAPSERSEPVRSRGSTRAERRHRRPPGRRCRRTQDRWPVASGGHPRPEQHPSPALGWWITRSRWGPPSRSGQQPLRSCRSSRRRRRRPRAPCATDRECSAGCRTGSPSTVVRRNHHAEQRRPSIGPLTSTPAELRGVYGMVEWALRSHRRTVPSGRDSRVHSWLFTKRHVAGTHTGLIVDVGGTGTKGSRHEQQHPCGRRARAASVWSAPGGSAPCSPPRSARRPRDRCRRR